MLAKQEPFAQINALLDQQREAIQGKIGALEALEYANRARRIRELVDILNGGDFSARPAPRQQPGKITVTIFAKPNV